MISPYGLGRSKTVLMSESVAELYASICLHVKANDFNRDFGVAFTPERGAV